MKEALSMNFVFQTKTIRISKLLCTCHTSYMLVENYSCDDIFVKMIRDRKKID